MVCRGEQRLRLATPDRLSTDQGECNWRRFLAAGSARPCEQTRLQEVLEQPMHDPVWLRRQSVRFHCNEGLGTCSEWMGGSIRATMKVVDK